MDARKMLEIARRARIARVFMAYPSTTCKIGKSNEGRLNSVGVTYARQAARGGGAMVFQQDGRPGMPGMPSDGRIIMWGLWGQLHKIVETLDFLTNGRKLCDRRGRLSNHQMLQLA